MKLYIDVARYERLPAGIKNDFTVWLLAEGLLLPRVTSITLGEGHAVITRHAVDGDGIETVEDGEIVTVTETVSIRSLPPLAAFEQVDG